MIGGLLVGVDEMKKSSPPVRHPSWGGGWASSTASCAPSGWTSSGVIESSTPSVIPVTPDCRIQKEVRAVYTIGEGKGADYVEAARPESYA